MAYYLEFDGSGSNVSSPIDLDFTDLTITATVSFDAISGSDRGIFQSWIQPGAGGGQAAFFVMWVDNPNGLQFAFNMDGIGAFTLTAPITLTTGVIYEIGARIRNGMSIDLIVDGVIEDTQSISVSFPEKTAGNFFIGDSSFLSRPFDGDLYLLTVEGNNGNPSRFDPSASGGTGLILTDTIGISDGTLNDFPIDDSQWVFYSAAGSSFIEALAPNTATTSIQTLDDVTGASINFGALSASANSVALNTVSGHSDTLALISSQSFPVPLDLQAGQFVSVSAEASTANVVQIGARSGYLVNAAPAESATGTLTLTERAGQVIAIEPGLASAIGTNLQQITGAIIGSFRRSSIIDMSTRYSTIDQTTSFTIEEV